MQNITLDLASPPDREQLVVQVMIGDEQFAEINQETDSLQIEIYGRRDGQPWTIDFDRLMVELANAKNRLIATRSIS